MEGHYVFRVTVRFTSPRAAVRIDPATAETTVTLRYEAPDPGTEGWLFFRNTLWRGEVGDEAHARDLAAEWLAIGADRIVGVSFRELQVDEAYLDALEAAIDADLDLFNADSVSEARSKYLGSSLRVTDGT